MTFSLMQTTTTTTEEWALVPGYPGYEVSTHGRVRRTAYLMKHSYNRKGYARLTLVDANGRKRSVTLHPLVLGAFRGARPDGQVGRHWDGDKTNNCLSNLLWETRRENWKDAVRNGECPDPDDPTL